MPIVTRGTSNNETPPPASPAEVGYATVTYIDPTGTRWPLTDTREQQWTPADGVSGLGAAPYSLTTDQHPRGGARLRHVQALARTITWPLLVIGDSHESFVSRWRALARAFTRTLRDGPGTLEFQRPDGSRRRIEVLYEAGFDVSGAAYAGITWDTAVLSLWCEDPYWYDPSPLVIHREHSVGEDYLTPFPSVSSGQVLGATTVNNPGDIVVWPEWTVTGPASLVTFTSADTGEAFTLNPTSVGGSLAAGEQVVVTTDSMRVRKHTAEVQTIDLGAATAGTVTITFNGQTTAAVAYNATAAQVQAAMEALPNVEPGDVLVTGGPLPAAVNLAFAGQYLGADVAQVTVTPTGLTGGTVTVSTTTTGSVTNWVGALNWPGAVLWGLEPGDNEVTFQLDGSGPGSAVDLSFNARYETV